MNQSLTKTKVVAKKRSFKFEVALGLLICGFGVLALLAKMYPYFGIDLIITTQIQRLPGAGIGSLLEIITYLGYLLPGTSLFLIGLLLLIMIKKAPDALVLSLSTIGAVLIGLLFKLLIDRPRPDPLIIHQLAVFQTTPSFPSGHVLFFIGFLGYFLYLTVIYLKKDSLQLLVQFTLLVLIVLMGVSRIYVGAHWFSDTLGAYLIGLVWLLFIIKVRVPLIDIFFRKSK